MKAFKSAKPTERWEGKMKKYFLLLQKYVILADNNSTGADKVFNVFQKFQIGGYTED